MDKTQPTLNFIPGESPLQLGGAAGPIEARLLCPKEREGGVIAIVCHPHSLHGGNFNNKVVTTITRMFRDMGIASIRFNFRGVGESAGEFDEGNGETEDLLTVLQWVQQQRPGDAIYLVGFSFGSYVALRAANRFPVAKLISIAPPVVNFPFHEQASPDMEWIVVMGEEDEIVDPAKVFAWLDTLPLKPTVIRMKDTSHFFHGKLVELKQKLQAALS